MRRWAFFLALGAAMAAPLEFDGGRGRLYGNRDAFSSDPNKGSSVGPKPKGTFKFC